MIRHLIAVGGVAFLCGAWVLFQKWIAGKDPGPPGVEGHCGCGGNPLASDDAFLKDRLSTSASCKKKPRR